MTTKEELQTACKVLGDKLHLIATTLKQLEHNAETMDKWMKTESYWEGRREALLDLREKIGSLEEFE